MSSGCAPRKANRFGDFSAEFSGSGFGSCASCASRKLHQTTPAVPLRKRKSTDVSGLCPPSFRPCRRPACIPVLKTRKVGPQSPTIPKIPKIRKVRKVRKVPKVRKAEPSGPDPQNMT
eukprot:scaffold876_cov243-Pinguiococcus_pyrenoidosus.AAC.50